MGAITVTELLATIFLGFGITVLAGAIVMVIGFLVSMPVGVAYAVKEHREHPLPPTPHKPHYHQMRMHIRTWRMPTMNDVRRVMLPSAWRR